MKINNFLIVVLGLTISLNADNKPTEHIVKHFWQSKNANTVSINVVPVQDNQAAIYFLEEKIIAGLAKDHYKTWITQNVAYDELLDTEKATFLGYFLKLMKERKISNKACIYLDDFTACTKVGDGYECHTIVEKQWVENLRKEKQ
jgi:hypothetical protein